MRRIKPDHDKSIFSHDQCLRGEISGNLRKLGRLSTKEYETAKSKISESEPFVNFVFKGVRLIPAPFLSLRSRLRRAGFCCRREPINTRGGIMEQSLALGHGIALSHAFESVPNRDIGINPFLDREVAFEHTALDAEFFDAPLKVRGHHRCELRRCGSHGALLPVEA